MFLSHRQKKKKEKEKSHQSFCIFFFGYVAEESERDDKEKILPHKTDTKSLRIMSHRFFTETCWAVFLHFAAASVIFGERRQIALS